MTSEQSKQFIAKYPNALSFIRPSHLEELSPLFEAHIEAIEVRKDEFHDLKGSFMPRKETLDKFVQAAGISFNQTAESTRKEGEGCYIGMAQAMAMGPDGKWIFGPICDYEFDCDVRVEEMKLNGKPDWEHKDDRGRPRIREYTEKELAQERVQFRKVGRQRANTGARSRATLAVLGMQTGFKDLFSKNEPPTTTRVFLFSRIIVNAKNEIVLNRMLDNIAGPTQALFGPQSSAKQISAPAHTDPAPYEGRDQQNGTEPMRDVTGSAADLAGQALDDDPFGPKAETADPKLAEAYQALGDWSNSDNELIAPRATAILNRGEKNSLVLDLSLLLMKYVASGKLRQAGINICLDALDNRGSDPIILADVEKKARGAFEARTVQAQAAAS